jgi:NADH dehydrogenase
MTTHRLAATQLVPRPLDEVFPFFATGRNLARITPPSMDLRFLTEDLPMAEGLRIAYRMKPVLGIPVTWQTRIEAWDPPHGFRDIQLRGPYRLWEHAHRFEAVAGGTLVTDEIDYAVPLGPFGEIANALVVRTELEQIFRNRSRVIDAVFAPAGVPTGRTVAVAGGTGFVGGGIAAELRRRGHRVIVISRTGEAARGELPDDVEIRQADVRESRGLESALEGADALVIALAFRNLPMESPRRGQTFLGVDARGTENLVAAARTAGLDQLVYISGAGAAPDATKHWFRAKWRAEEAVRTSARWTIVRPTWIYGPRDVALNRFVGLARRLPFVPLTNAGNQQLAPVFIDDVARLAADALELEAARNEVFEIGGPATLPMREIVRRALRVAGLRRPILPGPTPLLKLVALPLSRLPEPPLTPDAVDFVNQPATVDLQPLLDRLPRRLTPLEEGLRTYLGPERRPDRSLAFDGALRA